MEMEDERGSCLALLTWPFFEFAKSLRTTLPNLVLDFREAQRNFNGTLYKLELCTIVILSERRASDVSSTENPPKTA
jgi:hypothetical protein